MAQFLHLLIATPPAPTENPINPVNKSLNTSIFPNLAVVNAPPPVSTIITKEVKTNEKLLEPFNEPMIAVTPQSESTEIIENVENENRVSGKNESPQGNEDVSMETNVNIIDDTPRNIIGQVHYKIYARLAFQKSFR